MSPFGSLGNLLIKVCLLIIHSLKPSRSHTRLLMFTCSAAGSHEEQVQKEILIYSASLCWSTLYTELISSQVLVANYDSAKDVK